MESLVMEGLGLAWRWFIPFVAAVLVVLSLRGRKAAKALQLMKETMLPLNDANILIALALLVGTLPDALILDSMPVVISSTLISLSFTAIAAVRLLRVRKALKAAASGRPHA